MNIKLIVPNFGCLYWFLAYKLLTRLTLILIKFIIRQAVRVTFFLPMKGIMRMM